MFSLKLSNKEPSDVNALLSRIKTFIQTKARVENKVKDGQALRRNKLGNVKPRMSVQDHLGPRYTDSSRYDCAPLHAFRT